MLQNLKERKSRNKIILNNESKITVSIKKTETNSPEKSKISKVNPHYFGHRERLRHKIISGQGKSMADYELLELLLTYTQPRRDMKPTAKLLLESSGGIGDVMQSSDIKLAMVNGIGPAAICLIKLVQEFSLRSKREKLASKNILSSWDKLTEYCMAHKAHDDVECLYALYLNARHVLLKDQIIQTGTIDKLSIYPREIFRIAFAVGATGFILVHNHPSGNSAPSNADIRASNQIKDLASQLGLVFLDHIIVGAGNFSSLKNEGWL